MSKVYGDLKRVINFQDFNYERIAFEIGYLADDVKKALKDRLKHDYVNHLYRSDKANYFAIWNCDFQGFRLIDDIYFDCMTADYDYKLARLFLIDDDFYYRVDEELIAWVDG